MLQCCVKQHEEEGIALKSILHLPEKIVTTAALLSLPSDDIRSSGSVVFERFRENIPESAGKGDIGLSMWDVEFVRRKNNFSRKYST